MDSARGQGDLCERMILVALRDHPGVYGQRFKKLWLWNDWPGRLQQPMASRDVGIDIVAEEQDGGLCAIRYQYDNQTVSSASVDAFLATTINWSSRILIINSDLTKAAEEKLRNTPNTTILPASELVATCRTAQHNKENSA